MRNILKPAARTASSRARRSVRGVAAVVASFALAAGLGSYPVDAQETAVVSTATSAVQATRNGSVDTITIDDPDGESWGFGAKASVEDIFAIKRSGAGEIEEILSLTVDGTTLDPEFYGFTNNAMGGFIAFDLDALNEVPPKLVEVKIRTTDAATYSIAESDEVPTARELSASGYSQNAHAMATINPSGVGVARATADTKWSPEVALSSEIIGAGEQKFPEMGTERYFEVRPTGELPNQVGDDIRITRIVVRNTQDGSNRPDNEAEILINDGVDGTHYFKSATELRNEKNRVKGFEAVFFNPETGKSPVNDAFIIQSGQDSLKIGVDYIEGWDNNLATLRSRYVVEVYGSFRVPVEPTNSPAPSTTQPTSPASPSGNPTTPPTTGPSSPPTAPTTVPQPTTSSRPIEDETKRFAIEGQGGIRLNPATTTGESPYETTATVDGNSTFSKAVVRISAPNSILAAEAYSFNLDKTETGVSFERRIVSISSDYVEFEVYPVKNGQRVDSVQVPDGAKFTMTSDFSDNPQSVDAVATIHGTALTEKPVPPLPPTNPDGSDWMNDQVPNPEMAKKCGLKIAIVADLSLSLQNAVGSVGGFQGSRDAATAMVDALKDAPGTQVGIYNFATTAGNKGTTGKPVDVAVNGDVNPEITRAIGEWKRENGGGATNWEAGLKQVQGSGYDVVYFITDGMPTHDLSGWQNYDRDPEKALLPNAGAFVQATSLNRAILAANELKREGTRIVPVMVDLTLGNDNTVTQDYILKDLLSVRAYEAGGRNGDYLIDLEGEYAAYEGWESAAYAKGSGTNSWDLIVNAETAINTKNGSDGLMDIVNLKRRKVTDQEHLWTYGTRTVKEMGEDISGTGSTVHINEYSQLAGQLKKIANEISQFCEGKIIVQKQIVNANGEVLTDGADGWEFSVMANSPIIDAGNGDLVYADSKATATEEGADKPQASWNLVTDNPATATITEHQQEGYKLYQRDEKNAVCTQNLNGEESPLEVQNTGATGFRVPVNTSGSHVATVVCVVANTQSDQPNFGLEVKKVDLDYRNTTLSDAKFEVREVAAAEGEDPQTWTLETGADAGTYTLDTVLEPGKEYDLVEVKAPTQDGVLYSLLTAPVRFRGSIQDQGVAVEYQSNGKWVSDISTQGVWNVVSDKQTAYLEVANVRQGNMPKTGGAGVQLPILLGGTLIAAGALMGRRKVAA